MMINGQARLDGITILRITCDDCDHVHTFTNDNFPTEDYTCDNALCNLKIVEY